MLATLRKDWQPEGQANIPQGSLVAFPLEDYRATREMPRVAVLFTPAPRRSLAGYTTTRHHVIINELENVRNRLYVLTPSADGSWRREALATPEFGSVSASAVDDTSDDYWLMVDDFLSLG